MRANDASLSGRRSATAIAQRGSPGRCARSDAGRMRVDPLERPTVVRTPAIGVANRTHHTRLVRASISDVEDVVLIVVRVRAPVTVLKTITVLDVVGAAVYVVGQPVLVAIAAAVRRYGASRLRFGHKRRPWRAGQQQRPASERKHDARASVCDSGADHRGQADPIERRKTGSAEPGDTRGKAWSHVMASRPRPPLLDKQEAEARIRSRATCAPRQATATAKEAKRSPGSGWSSRQVIAMGVSDSCCT